VVDAACTVYKEAPSHAVTGNLATIGALFFGLIFSIGSTSSMHFHIEKSRPEGATAPKRRGRPPKSQPPPPTNPENDGFDDGMSPIASLDAGNLSDFLIDIPTEAMPVSKPKPKTKAVAKKRAMTPCSDDDEGSEYEFRAPMRQRARTAAATAKRQPSSKAQATKRRSKLKPGNIAVEGDGDQGDQYGGGKNGDTINGNAMRHSIPSKKLLRLHSGAI
jgi:type IV secretory pathway VirB10-like protein